MKSLFRLSLVVASVALAALASAGPVTVSFTATDVKSAIGTPLHDSANQWGIWAVRVRPVVTGGGYSIAGGNAAQPGWGASAPSSYSWAGYGNNLAWFWDASGAEAGYPANPLYMIMDQPAATFTSYFGNTVTAVDDASLLSFSFTLDPGATFTGEVEFLVDGSKYTLGSAGTPGTWVEDFFGNYGHGGGLAGNMGDGFRLHVPDFASTLALLMPTLCALVWIKRRHA